MNLNDYTNFQEKTIAEFRVAITETEHLIEESIKKKDVIGVLKAFKLKAKLENLLNKKIKDGAKHGYDSHKRI